MDSCGQADYLALEDCQNTYSVIDICVMYIGQKERLETPRDILIESQNRQAR
jgi:hypothetical protein